MALEAGRKGVASNQVDSLGKIKGIDIPIATSSKAGLVKPVTKTAGMTQDVGIDSSGKLYTEPGAAVHEYKTTDQIVGKWIDNSDVYEIVLQIGSNGLSDDLSDLNIKEIIEMFGPGSTSPIVYDVACVSGTVSRAVYYSTSDKKIHCDGTQTVPYVIMKYIKEV